MPLHDHSRVLHGHAWHDLGPCFHGPGTFAGSVDQSVRIWSIEPHCQVRMVYHPGACTGVHRAQSQLQTQHSSMHTTHGTQQPCRLPCSSCAPGSQHSRIGQQQQQQPSRNRASCPPSKAQLLLAENSGYHLPARIFTCPSVQLWAPARHTGPSAAEPPLVIVLNCHTPPSHPC
jgi:hypothetical protein